MQIFSSNREYQHFLQTLAYYQINEPKPRFSIFNPTDTNLDYSKKMLEIITYCLMPNHFHLLVRQTENEGITKTIGQLANSYTRYFNLRHERIGPLFQGRFQAALVDKDDYLAHLSRYIHLNPVTSGIVPTPEKYTWSSYLHYAEGKQSELLSTKINAVLDYFQGSRSKYKKFVNDHIDYAKQLERIKHLVFE